MKTFSHSRQLLCRDLRFGNDRLRYLAGFDCAPELGAELAAELAGYTSVMMVVDGHARAHAERLLATMAEVPGVLPVYLRASEQGKRLATVENLLELAVERGMGRRSAVVAMGGGVTGNVAGMVAALLYRGVPLIHMPTTPVAAFDSVLSMKQAVNLRQGKNLCGTYLVPKLIACDLAWLLTVPDDQMAVGLAEMAKNVLAVTPSETERFTGALAGRRKAPEHALEALLDIGISAKAGFLSEDAHERGAALVFEYGHTFGHALEIAALGIIPHGEAVAWGMLVAAELAVETRGLPEADRAEHYRLAEALGLHAERLAGVDLGTVRALLSKDNKRGYLDTADDAVPMVLLDALGKPAMSVDKPLVPVPMGGGNGGLGHRCTPDNRPGPGL
ncbi:iron-containing alcohol dehydrogenase [Streptomyces sp. NPDC059853]|uniref:3-dehydroquinate synthase family protein n=1 Tax=Streptomyces sp. NPDC059853 TaxID=3346973 RepID=UPI0036529428